MNRRRRREQRRIKERQWDVERSIVKRKKSKQDASVVEREREKEKKRERKCVCVCVRVHVYTCVCVAGQMEVWPQLRLQLTTEAAWQIHLQHHLLLL